MNKSCFTCRYLRRESESWELPDIVWFECRAYKQISMLKQFPFKHTKCKKWEDGRELRWDEPGYKIKEYKEHE
jgi:hypothetical protein